MPIARLTGPLLADQGADFHAVITYTATVGTPVDLTAGWSVEWVWGRQGDGLPADLTVGDGLTLGVDGTITALVPAAVTAGWGFRSVPFRLFVTDPTGATDVLLEGVVTLDAGRVS